MVRLAFPMVVVINDHTVYILHNKSADFIGRAELVTDVKQDPQGKKKMFVYEVYLWFVCLLHRMTKHRLMDL